MKIIERQWEKSAYEIKDNILVQCQIICPIANFGEVNLDKHIKDGRIKMAPLANDGNGDELIPLALDA